jgi:protease-4
MRKFLGTFVIVITVFFMGGCFLTINNLIGEYGPKDAHVSKPAILFLKLEGVILDGGEFLEGLKKYAKDDDIKGVLIQINSPGGVVGPSQEINSEIMRVRKELKKPVVVSCSSLAASGAYYAAVAADKIVTNPGSMLGSIGVIMEFVNLEKLYDWAKVRRYTIKTGAYKDSGAEYREMREDERQLFQEMANEVFMQFKKTVADSRKLSLDFVSKYADGRVITGASAVSLGFADEIGTLEDATRIIGQLSGLGKNPEIFEPPPKRPDFLSQFYAESKGRNPIKEAIDETMNLKLKGQPLLIMRGAYY